MNENAGFRDTTSTYITNQSELAQRQGTGKRAFREI